METFKENTYYPVDTKLIYKDKIVEVQKRDPSQACNDCMFVGDTGCSTVVCYKHAMITESAVKYVVIGDAPKKAFTRAIGEKFEYDGKWYVVKKAIECCKGCAFRDIDCFNPKLNRGGCSKGGLKIFVEIPASIKHDKPGVEYNTIMSYIDDIEILENIANRNNAFVTVEPVAKKDIPSRIIEAIDAYYMNGGNRSLKTPILLISYESYRELQTYYNNLYGTPIEKITMFENCNVRRSPDVKDIEVV